MADGIAFEKLGVQSAAILTDVFTRTGDAMARAQGMPGYRYALVPHPVSSLSPDECAGRAGEVLSQVLTILGLEDGGDTQAPAGAPGVGETSPPAGDRAFSVENLTAQQVDDFQRVAEYYFEQGWTDGLPVVPVTADTVRAFVERSRRDPQEVIATVDHLGTRCTVELAAAAAAMAGCRAEHFGVVLAAVEAIQPHLSVGFFQSTTGQGELLIVNGPVRHELGFNSGASVFGPGFRANATIGRAVRLVAMNALGLRPQEFDQATQGTPAKYGCCIAENEEESPWEPLHVERGWAPGTSVVTASLARSTLAIENRSSNRPEEILRTIADSMSYAGVSRFGKGHVVVLGPEHAQLLAGQGWSREDVRRFLWDHWGRPAGEVRRWGVYGEDGAEQLGDDGAFVRFGDAPDGILLVVAGARNAGVSTLVPTVRPMYESREVR